VPQLELRVPPLVIVAALVAAIIAVSMWLPVAGLSFPGHRTFAVAAAVAGLAVVVLGVVELRRAHTTLNPMAPQRATAVIDSGIYGWTRNPMYLGLALVLLGVAAWNASLLGYTAVPLFCAYMNRFQIRPEERALLAKFGPAFSDYTSRVRRWI
jgi:protein-S-isoprenylcysteine O-methyltransferase Ste14